MKDALHEAIFDNLLEGVYYVDKDRRIVIWNHAAEIITGFSRAEVINRKCADGILCHVDEEGHLLCVDGCPLKSVISSGEPKEQTTPVYLHHKDGHRVPIVIRAAPVKNETGETVGAVEMFHHAGKELEQKERMHALEEMAYLDPLTGLANRRFIITKIDSRLDELRRYAWPVGVLFIDIDHFKKINDTLGHDIGDEVLKIVAATLRATARSFDLVGRWGGEEFIAVVRNCTEEQLVGIAERFRILTEASTLRREDAPPVTISIGATLGVPEDTRETFVKRADRGLYEAKETGRNRVTLKKAQLYRR